MTIDDSKVGQSLPWWRSSVGSQGMGAVTIAASGGRLREGEQYLSVDSFDPGLQVSIVLNHDRRHLKHFNATEHPATHWTA